MTLITHWPVRVSACRNKGHPCKEEPSTCSRFFSDLASQSLLSLHTGMRAQMVHPPSGQLHRIFSTRLRKRVFNVFHSFFGNGNGKRGKWQIVFSLYSPVICGVFNLPLPSLMPDARTLLLSSRLKSLLFRSLARSVSYCVEWKVSVVMQRLSSLTVTVLSNKMTWNRIVPFIQDRPQKA